uniref:Uncharacterized protein n=1 Tax=Cacopsylla melanoneura TaxID=428564 RepID=A0A8D8QKM6_9HEMI
MMRARVPILRPTPLPRAQPLPLLLKHQKSVISASGRAWSSGPVRGSWVQIPSITQYSCHESETKTTRRFTGAQTPAPLCLIWKVVQSTRCGLVRCGSGLMVMYVGPTPLLLSSRHYRYPWLKCQLV